MSTTKLAEALRALLKIRNRPIPACDPVRLEAEAALASYEAAQAEAKPAPAFGLIGYLVRSKAHASEAVEAGWAERDLGYLWSYMHGVDDLEATEACERLEVVRLFAAAPAAPANLAQTIRGITEAYRGTDCGKCAESIGDRLIEVLAAPAAHAQAALTDAELDAAIHAADLYARDYDAREFGLPIHSKEHMARMRVAMRVAIKEAK